MSRFNDVGITTRTILATVKTSINCSKCIYFLPVFRMEDTEDDVITKSNKDQYNPETPGAILSSQCIGKDRLIERGIHNDSGVFGHCVSGYACNGFRVVHYKIASNSIILAGKTEKEDATEVFNVFIGHLKRANRAIENLTEREKRQLLRWIRSFKGKRVAVMKNTYQLANYEEENGENVEFLHEIKIPKRRPGSRKWSRYIIDYCLDCRCYEDLKRGVKIMLSEEKLFSGKLEISDIKSSLLTHNYDLGFPIIPWKLHQALYEIDGVYSTYVNTVHSHVRIVIPHQVSPDNANYISSKSDPGIGNVTLIVYSSGHVTQSGKVEEYNKVAYSLMLKITKALKDTISQ